MQISKQLRILNLGDSVDVGVLFPTLSQDVIKGECVELDTNKKQWLLRLTYKGCDMGLYRFSINGKNKIVVKRSNHAK